MVSVPAGKMNECVGEPEYWGYTVTVIEQWSAGHDDDLVVMVSDEDFHAAAREALAELGLTYEQLREQARERDFCSARAHALWVSIGGTVDL